MKRSLTPVTFVRKFGAITGDTWRTYRAADGRTVDVRTRLSEFYFPPGPVAARNRLTGEQARIAARNMIAGQDRRRAAREAAERQQKRGRSR